MAEAAVKIEDQADENTQQVPAEKPDSSWQPPRKEDKYGIRNVIKEVREREAKPAAAPKAPPAQAKPEKAPDANTGDRNRDEAGRFARQDDKPAEAPTKATGLPEIPAPSIVPDAPAAAASKPSAPPPSWSQEAKSQWTTLPPAIQAAVLKREEEASNGFKAKTEELNRYREVAQVLDQARPVFQARGVRSDAEAIKGLVSWAEYLRVNPRQGLMDLARQYGVNLSPQAQPSQAQTEGQDQTQTEVPAYARQLFDHLGSVDQRVNSVLSRFEQENNARVAQEIAAFSKDKPHFERVKTAMGHFMKAAADAGQPIDLNEAYQRATWADPEVRAEILAEQDAERQRAAAKAAKEAEDKRKADEAKRAAEAEAKRKASVSPKGSTPSGKAGASKRPPHAHSVRDSIKAAREELEGRA